MELGRNHLYFRQWPRTGTFTLLLNYKATLQTIWVYEDISFVILSPLLPSISIFCGNIVSLFYSVTLM